MKKPLPHLHRDRHGTFYFRLTVGGKTIKRSLRTKLPALANIKAAALNWELSAMGSPKEPTIAEISAAFKAGKVREFDAEFPDGTKITGINSDDDLRRAKELMEKRVELIGRIEPDIRIPRPAAGRAPEASGFHKANPKKFLAAVKPYMAEMELEGVNNLKTREDKESTYAAFAARFENPRMDAIDKAMAVSFKTHLLKETRAKPGRVNTKIGQLSEFFKWAMGNEETEENPFEGIRISKKSKLMPTVPATSPRSTQK
ncbi:MAG: hypothetical protein V4505_25340 [Pseudomonadota bacterium]